MDIGDNALFEVIVSAGICKYYHHIAKKFQIIAIFIDRAFPRHYNEKKPKGVNTLAFIRDAAYHQCGRTSLTRHRHTDDGTLEIIQILDGEGSVLIQDKTYALFPGMLFFIDAADVHFLNPQNEASYRRNKLIVDKATLHRALEAVGDTELLNVFRSENGGCFIPEQTQLEQIDEVFRSVCTTPQSSGTATLYAVVQLIQLALPRLQTVPSESDARISAILQFIRQHYAEPLSVESIAEQVMMSKFHLCHLFRTHTGMTVMQYLNEQRLHAARSMLSRTTRPVVEIALACGFGSSSHFSTVFRSREGLTPREYRQRHADTGSLPPDL